MKAKQASRREFLKQTTAMGAVAAFSTSDRLPLLSSEYHSGGDDVSDASSPQPVGWTLPSHILNIVWDDVYPRLMPLLWRDGIPTAYQIFNLSPNQDLLEYLGTVGAEFGQGNQLVLRGINALRSQSPSEEFKNRLTLLERYLRRRRPYNRINPVPIKLLSGQGFDFVLSDEGLELAQPPKPSSCPASTYLRYTFRKVGEAPILIPNTASSVRAPILGGFPPDHPRRSHAMSAFGALSNETAGIPTHVNLWSTQISDLVSSFPPFSQNCSTEEWLMTMFGEDHDPKNEWDEERVLRLDLAAYQFINRPKRDWQLTGAVYSGIMRELPRIFASVWYTEATSCACDDSGDACGDDYRTRYERNPRDLLEERIEAWLPEKLNYTEWDQDVTEVIFEQSEGEGKMRLPMIPTAPSVDEMMQEWIAGQSVNPQFTDCVRTH